MTKLYGIPNCDTVKRARAWLDEHGIAYDFHDFKKSGLSEAMLQSWVAAQGWERVLNRKGTSWRKLDDAVRNGVSDAASAMRVMLTQPSTIKRPVIEWPDGAVSVGFDAEDWASRL